MMRFMKWVKKKIFNSFEEANKLRNNLKESGEITKIRRCGPGGTKFKVVVGSEIKTDKKNPKLIYENPHIPNKTY